MKEDFKAFAKGALLVILILIAVLAFSIYFMINEVTLFTKGILIIIILSGFIFNIMIIWSLVAIYRLNNGKNIDNISSKTLDLFVSLIYPLLKLISKITGIDINILRRSLIQINNLIVNSKDIKVRKEDILILLPHCLQNAQCDIKVTNDINNCKMCGKCNIKDMLDLVDKYKVKVVVATGGTLARQWIKRYKPKAIIAVACERDLISGVTDVKSIPVKGIFNERPNGPCFNTKVDMKKIEEAIVKFMKEE
ncbi:DUF116 domain-containing protein [Clostridiisalibacter paucivorans]|uniref:DUF116 domain-containing protein n=1 Tax=Clostridiisalibacter paucivorans TaxID=408753 RepID=UPI00047E23A8|nr:DUF116 domain-containing protein [Clostridiisalibacter paucivorans]